MRVAVVDPPAYTPPYDHSLCAALARRGLDVELATSHFRYGPVPREDRYRLVGDLGVAPGKVHVIPHGTLDYLARQPDQASIDPRAGDLEGRRVVLFFGLLRPYKGIDVLIEAFAGTPKDAVLLVVGKPRMPVEPLERFARDLGIGDRVRVIPRFFADPEIPAYFRPAGLSHV